MMTQYRELKRRFPDHLLLFRLGDFYELFAEDAELGARLLQITLTSRQSVPMAGIPHHAADGYIARLVQAGQKIAICEQMEGRGSGKKLLHRDVVRVVTPGTLTDSAYLASAANNFLMALGRSGASTGVALLDVSTGDFWVGEDGPGEDAVLAAALLRRPAGLLRQWLLQPLLDTGAIRARQDAVAALMDAPETRAALRRLLKPVGDLARLTSRATLGVAHARDLVGLRACLAPLEAIRAASARLEADLVVEARAALADL